MSSLTHASITACTNKTDLDEMIDRIRFFKNDARLSNSPKGEAVWANRLAAALNHRETLIKSILNRT